MIKNIPISFVKLALTKLGLMDLQDYRVQRLSTCYKCNDGKALCPSCGCIVEAKVIEKDEICPQNKWTDIETKFVNPNYSKLDKERFDKIHKEIIQWQSQ